MHSRKSINIVWFKRDLRLVDHAPLQAALKHDLPILPLYMIEPEYWQQKTSSSRHWSFIYDSLSELNENCKRLGQPLTFRIGEAVDVLRELSQSHQIHSVFAHEETGNLWTFRRDQDVASFCAEHNIKFEEFSRDGVVRRLKNRDYWSQLRQERMHQNILPAPNALRPIPDIDPGILPSKDHPLFVHKVDGKTQKGGRSAGLALVDEFIKHRSSRYLKAISSPIMGPDFSSRLSSHLTWGTLSEREVVQKLSYAYGLLNPGHFNRRGIRAVLTRLSWRSHFMQKLEDQPDLESKSMHPFYEGLRPEDENTATRLSAWEEGKTGFPIIDACMRYLRHEGWLPFRMRAMLVSFASYHLWIDWRLTAPHLARLFTDYEPGIHYSQFQMQSGVTGINTMRVYNPLKQSYDHDPQGEFIKSNIPELAHLPSEWLHEVNNIPPLIAAEFGFKIGHDYPHPIVENMTAMRDAKNKMTAIKKRDGFEKTAASVFKKLGSRNRPSSPQKRSPKKTSHDQLDLF